ncbi:MAG TPA: 50S ribosomal protein L10 [Tenuifilaceae bacterium]|nr:50S ribosomal protein L10 [Tenuifilaceae bacterium]HPE19050.1 50S ribosomal protein L10 [Tenuifilaceae bacterium]HPJ46478.1 50S ribosomal protein L10 [Tenuifilaceae bacterium]HPQ34635.1 50S ribosomal protein L10 [Tenuifilaceae bacterium]HRX68601.1 50S ribosomal protein L10 [Tenuifilaceae bacterium]
MRREEKNAVIDRLAEQINEYPHFYLADTSELNAADTSNLRRKCFEKEIKLVVVKNTLLKKALEKCEKADFSPIFESLKGSTSVMFTETGNVPAKLIKDFRKTSEKPVLKAAFVEESFYIGDNQLEALVRLKSKNELIADVIALLQSPAQTVLSQLQSGRNTIAGVVKTLSEREA